MDKQQVLSALEGLSGDSRSSSSGSKSSDWFHGNFSRTKRPDLGDDLLAILDRIEASGYLAKDRHSTEYVWAGTDITDPDYIAYDDDEETGEEIYTPYRAVIDCIVADNQKEPLVVVAVVVNGRDAGGLGGFIEQMPERAGVEYDIVQVERGEDEAGLPKAKITQDISVDVGGRDILLLTWVIGTGCTANRVATHLQEKNPKAVRVGAVIDDTERRTVPVQVDYRVVELERRAVIGVAKGDGFNFPCLVI